MDELVPALKQIMAELPDGPRDPYLGNCLLCYIHADEGHKSDCPWLVLIGWHRRSGQ